MELGQDAAGLEVDYAAYTERGARPTIEPLAQSRVGREGASVAMPRVMPLRMSSATRPNKPIGDRTPSRAGARRWTHGRGIAKAARATTCWRSSGRRERSVAPRSALDPLGGLPDRRGTEGPPSQNIRSLDWIAHFELVARGPTQLGQAACYGVAKASMICLI